LNQCCSHQKLDVLTTVLPHFQTILFVSWEAYLLQIFVAKLWQLPNYIN